MAARSGRLPLGLAWLMHASASCYEMTAPEP